MRSAPGWELPSHELIFARHSDTARKDYDIWRMCGDGTQLASLVQAQGQQLQIAVAPNGNEFIYSSNENGPRDLFRRGFAAGDAINITNHPADDAQPAWSPDGSKIVFSSKRDSTKAQLYMLQLDSGEVSRITRNTHYDSGATFSSDGKRIFFTRYISKAEEGDRGGSGEIVALSLSDLSETPLTTLGGYNGDPDPSPDGKHIAFHRVADGRAEIWLMNTDGSNAHAITDTHIDEYSPSWSPDGRWLAITAGSGNDSLGTFDLWLLSPDGTHRQLLNGAANTEAWQVWRPGKHRCR